VLGAITGYFLLSEHRAHFFGALPLAFVLILRGFLLQWPTLLTLAMFPILLLMYGGLAVTEEAEMRAQFGEEFERYAQRTPRFFPRMTQDSSAA
jgi:protein-S-isoprenylcysteine O-methyltransferase Ste14